VVWIANLGTMQPVSGLARIGGYGVGQRSVALFRVKATSMTSNPYKSPAQVSETGSPDSVLIRAMGEIAIPQRCVVCDSEHVVLTRQTQDRLPLPMPGFVVVRSIDLTLPYCEAHIGDLAYRTKRLGHIQLAAAGGLVIPAVIAGPLLPAIAPKLELFGIVTAAILMTVSALVFLATLVVKPSYLYDVRVTQERDGIRFISRYATFLQRLAEANSATGFEPPNAL
jgi:hypothetical protein